MKRLTILAINLAIFLMDLQ